MTNYNVLRIVYQNTTEILQQGFVKTVTLGVIFVSVVKILNAGLVYLQTFCWVKPVT